MKLLKSWNILSRLKFHLTNSVLITLGLLVVLLCACKQKTHDYYAGIIIDEFGKPIEGVFVKEDLADKYAGTTTTDKNGFFKLKASTLEGVILKKEGYITDTVPMVWHHAGETTEYSRLITEDSSKHELQKVNGRAIVFLHKEFKNKPEFFQITNPKFKPDSLFGIWMEDENNGFKITKDRYYAYGFNGNRNMRYTLKNDTLTIFKDDYYFYRRGIIKKLESDGLEILWNKQELLRYTKK